MIGPLVVQFVRDFMRTSHVGKANAIHRGELLAIVRGHGYDVDDRELRKIYADMLFLPSCELGVFWPQSWKEIESAAEYQHKKLIGTADRIARMKSAWRSLESRAGEQMSLGI